MAVGPYSAKATQGTLSVLLRLKAGFFGRSDRNSTDLGTISEFRLLRIEGILECAELAALWIERRDGVACTGVSQVLSRSDPKRPQVSALQIDPFHRCDSDDSRRTRVRLSQRHSCLSPLDGAFV